MFLPDYVEHMLVSVSWILKFISQHSRGLLNEETPHSFYPRIQGAVVGSHRLSAGFGSHVYRRGGRLFPRVEAWEGIWARREAASRSWRSSILS